MRDLYEPSRIEDESTRMDLYVPTYATKAEALRNPYDAAYAKAVEPRDYATRMQPTPTTAQDPFT